MSNKSIRIRTTPGESKNIQIKVEQDFDFLEILSLKISQQDLYNTFCADYGVVVGRVIANAGFGVPNAKVSVFVPISSEDEKNQLLKDLYPYKSVVSKNKKNIRYNLLLSKATCELNTAVGTFPTKEEVLNNDIMIEVFEKYYKYTTKTNEAGDYMIFGVPTGQQTVHMDVDLSDAGPFSTRPYDFIDNGYPEKLFKSRVEFKKSENLDTLPQIKSGNKGVSVIPFWGDEETCQIGITRVDFDTNFKFEPTSILMGSIYTDSGKNSLNKRCNPRNKQGEHEELRTGPGILEVIRVDEYTYDSVTNPTKVVPLSLEEFTLPQGPQSIDDNGAFCVTVPMNLDHVITDEFGNLVPSFDPEKGVATKGMYRFKIKFSEPPAAPKRRTASLIFPTLNRSTGGTTLQTNLPGTPGTNNSTENARWSDNINVWKDNSNNLESTNHSIYKDFHTFEFNQIYSISQYQPKYKKGGNRWSFLGMKDVDDSNFNYFPFTTVMKGFSILYVIMKLVIKLQAALMKLLIFLSNLYLLVCFQVKFSFTVLGVTVNLTILNMLCLPVRPFEFLKNVATPVTLDCESDSSFPQVINNWGCTAAPNPCSNCVCTNTCLRFLAVYPGLTTTSCASPALSCSFYCLEYAIVDRWLCCALYDLAVDRNVIRYTFHDAWLTGTAYMPQFKYKSRTKSNGTQKDKFCGPGGDTSGSDNYKDQKCCERGVGPAGFGSSDTAVWPFNNGTCRKCIVRSGQSGTSGALGAYHQNNYDTGASDIDDLIYCPESYPTKIVNLGRTDACLDVIDRIDRCIISQECMLDVFNSAPCNTGTNGLNNCLTGTYFESGYDTEQWVSDMGLTSYQNPAMVILSLMPNCGQGVEQLFDRSPAKYGGDNPCNEYECDDNVWNQIREVSKLYTDIIIGADSQGFDTFQQFEFDPQQRPRFHPSWFGSSLDNDQTIGTQNPAHHLANIPYFYFGLINGGTAIDKLRKEYLVEKK